MWLYHGVKVVLVQGQKAKIRFRNVAVGHARAHREGRIDQRIDIDAACTNRPYISLQPRGNFTMPTLAFWETFI